MSYRNSFNVSATIFFYFSLFGNFWSDVLAISSGTTCTTDMLYTSLKSPKMQLLESEIKLGVASPRQLPRPLKCDYLFRVTIFKGPLTLKELRYFFYIGQFLAKLQILVVTL
jgi:hypothetical protein